MISKFRIGHHSEHAVAQIKIDGIIPQIFGVEDLKYEWNVIGVSLITVDVKYKKTIRMRIFPQSIKNMIN